MATHIYRTVGPAGSGATFNTFAAAVAGLDPIANDQIVHVQLMAGELVLTNTSDAAISGLNVNASLTATTGYIIVESYSGVSFRDHAGKDTNPLFYNPTYGAAARVRGANYGLAFDWSSVTFVQDVQLMRDDDGGGAPGRLARVSGRIKNSILWANRPTYNEALVQFVELIQCDVGCLFNSSETLLGIRFATGAIVESCNIGVYGTSSGGKLIDGSPQGGIAVKIRNTQIIGLNSPGTDFTPEFSYCTTTMASLSGTGNVVNQSAANLFVAPNTDRNPKTGSAAINAGQRQQTYTGDIDILNRARSTSTPTVGPREFNSGGGGGDTTAPILSSPSTSNITATAARGTATTDEANGTLFGIVSTSATPPTAIQVEAGQSNSGASASWAGSLAITSVGAKNLDATGLGSNTGYYFHFMHKDSSGNRSAVLTSSLFTTLTSGDTTPPTLSSALGSSAGTTSAAGSVSTNEANGTLFYKVSQNATETASTLQSTGLSRSVTTTGVQNVTQSGGLTPNTTYRMHFVHVDAAGNVSNVISSATFTTANGGGTITTGTLSNLSGQAIGATTLTWLAIIDFVTGNTVATLLSVPVNSSSVASFSQADVVPGQAYAVMGKTTAGVIIRGWGTAV